jgi:hypothetical protein
MQTSLGTAENRRNREKVELKIKKFATANPSVGGEELKAADAAMFASPRPVPAHRRAGCPLADTANRPVADLMFPPSSRLPSS